MTQPDAVSQGEMERWRHEALARNALERRTLALVAGLLDRLDALESTLSAITHGMEDAERTPEEWRATATNELLHHSGTPVGTGREDGQGERLAKGVDNARLEFIGLLRIAYPIHDDCIDRNVVALLKAAAALRASQADGERVEGVAHRKSERVWNFVERGLVCADWPRATLLIHPATESREAPKEGAGPGENVNRPKLSGEAMTATVTNPSRPARTPAQPDAPRVEPGPEYCNCGNGGCEVCYPPHLQPAPVESGEEKEAGEEVHAVDLVDELCEAVRSRDYSRNDMKGYDRVVMARKAILDRLSPARSPLPHKNEPVAPFCWALIHNKGNGVWGAHMTRQRAEEVATEINDLNEMECLRVVPLFAALPDQKAMRCGTAPRPGCTDRGSPRPTGYPDRRLPLAHPAENPNEPHRPDVYAAQGGRPGSRERPPACRAGGNHEPPAQRLSSQRIAVRHRCNGRPSVCS